MMISRKAQNKKTKWKEWKEEAVLAHVFKEEEGQSAGWTWKLWCHVGVRLFVIVNWTRLGTELAHTQWEYISLLLCVMQMQTITWIRTQRRREKENNKFTFTYIHAMMMTFHLARAEMKRGKKKHHRPTRCLSATCRTGKRGVVGHRGHSSWFR